MKIDWNKKYTTIATYALIIICLAIVFYQITTEMNSFKIKLDQVFRIFQPFLMGFVMAYLFNFILKFYENRLVGKLGRLKARKRGLSMLLTYLTVILIAYVFSNFVFPQVVASLSGIVNNIPTYIDETSRLFMKLGDKLPINDEISDYLLTKWDEAINYGINFLSNLLPMLANLIRSIISSLWNLVIGIIVSIYILKDKEDFLALSKKMTRGIFSQEWADYIIKISRRANYIFSRFIGGKLLDSLIIGIMTFIVLKIVKMPFPILVAFIIGITNVIPFFGPFIGAIPCTIIILFESPIMALWFILIIVIIQQIDGNIIGPKILGDSLGISAFWILFSLMVTGKLLGFIGLIIGVPLFTLIYSIVKDVIEARLARKGLPIETKEYMK